MRASFADPPEIWAGPPSALRQVYGDQCGRNASLRQSGLAAMDERPAHDSRMARLSTRLSIRTRRYPMVTIIHGGPSSRNGAVVRQSQRERARLSGLLCFHAQSARQFRARRSLYESQRQGFWLRRLARRPGWNRCSAQSGADRRKSSRADGLELRRIHRDVGRDADDAL